MTTPSVPPAITYKDAKGRLTFAGVVEFILAGFCLLAMAATALAGLVAKTQAARPGALRIVLTFGIPAALLVVLGIGSVRARRWARAIGLCLGWMGLVFGTFGVGFVLWALPHMQDTMRARAEATGRPMPPAAAMIASITIVGTIVFIYIIVPAVFVLCYRGEDARRTCEERDPTPRWTDRVPLPILAAVLMHAGAVVAMMVTIVTYGRATLVFGALVTGPVAIGIHALFIAVFAFAAIGFYRLDRRAYWTYLGAMVIFALNAWISFRGDGMMRVYRALDLPAAQLEALEKSPLIASGAMPAITVLGVLGMIGWTLWLKRYFVAAPAQLTPAAAPGDSTS